MEAAQHERDARGDEKAHEAAMGGGYMDRMDLPPMSDTGSESEDSEDAELVEAEGGTVAPSAEEEPDGAAGADGMAASLDNIKI